MELDKVYFFTATILDSKMMLENEKYKSIIAQSLEYLVRKGKVKVYDFVIMPNHIHIIWELLDLNGKEMPHASFMKYTSHLIQKDLRENSPNDLNSFAVDSYNRDFQFWQRNSLSTEVYTPSVVFQKLNYIHNNSCKGKWMLAASPIDYKFSSSGFYETGNDEYGFLTHVGDRL
jgi:REP element-mobilizing transposase RayT